jgi:Zn-dependent protease
LERCAVCGAEEFIPYICRYCGGIHCVYHRLPENHECPNIEQARAPKPILRTEKRAVTPTVRTLKTPTLSKISGQELRALVVALLVLAVSFSVKYLFLGFSLVQFLEILSLTMIVIGTGFLGHELAHKFTAERYGCWAEFKLWTYGALMALLFAFVSQGLFVFAAPGAVYIASRSGYFGEGLDKKTNGIVSLMGPVVNIVAASLFLAGYAAARLAGFSIVIGTISTGFNFLQQGVQLNLWLGAFNMLPIFILDGQKVFAWDKKTWALLSVPLWIAAFTVPSLLT